MTGPEIRADLSDQGAADVIPPDAMLGAAWETEHDTTLSSDQRSCCLRAAGAFQAPRAESHNPDNTPTQPHTRRQRLKVREKSKSGDRRRQENKSFLNVFVVQKTRVVFSCELTPSNV